MQKLNRVYHPVSKWEEIIANMWGFVPDRKEMLKMAITFTGDSDLYGSYMDKVVREWPFSCENALTDYSLNRKAWVGHAACAMAIRCPEDITREAWGLLGYEQQVRANRRAAIAIRDWEEGYRTRKGIRTDVGQPLLF